jgi:cytidyltransferase-like protein
MRKPMGAKALYLYCVSKNGLTPKDKLRLHPSDQKRLQLGYKNRFWLAKSEREKFKVALTGGVFDIIHMGHILTLKEASKHADLLVVVVSTDKRVLHQKKRPPIHSAECRRDMVASIRWVDLAIVGSSDILDTFYRVLPDVVVFGYDQKEIKLPLPAKVVRLKAAYRPKMSKTSKIIRQLGL